MNEFLKLWSECKLEDRTVLLQDIHKHIEYCTHRRSVYLKQYKDNLDVKILEAFDNRERAATLVYEFLGGNLET